jgi:hypothetical protein
MPFVFTQGFVGPDRAVDGLLCTDRNDRASGVAVKVRLVSNGQQLLIEPSDLRDVVSAINQDGKTEFAVSPGSNRRATIESIKHARLARANNLLRQLTDCLKPIAAESSESEFAETLQRLFDLVAAEREHKDAPPRSSTISEGETVKT